MTAFLHALYSSFETRTASPALHTHGRSITYRELKELVRNAAARLQSLGVNRGDRVAVCTCDKQAFLVSFLGAIFAGAVPLPLNPRFTREELLFFLRDSEARLAVAGADVVPVLERLKSETLGSLIVVSDQEMLGPPSNSFREIDVIASDPALIIYSSGTTGWPKGIVHTHGNLLTAMRALQSCWRFTADDVVLNVLPLFHIHGLAFATLMPLLAGASVTIDDFEPPRTLAALRDCTVFMSVPTIYYRFLEDPAFLSSGPWPNVRLFTCGSAPIRPEVLPTLEGILGRPVINRYGMSEAFVITSLPLDGPWPSGSVGVPLDGIDVRIVADLTTGRLAAPGEVGSVQLRGPNLFREYWRQPETTRAAFADGWFDTGDLGSRDAAGFLTLAGRKNELIITSGYNVYPQVVERVINSCPGVRESAVFGVPDARKGERVVAAVVRDDLSLDEPRLREFWSERLVDYQRPREIVFVDALPRNALGKVLRRELREQIERRAER